MTKQELYDKLYKKIQDEFPSAHISMVDVAKATGNYSGIQIAFDRRELNPVFNLDKLVKQIETEKDFEDISANISDEINKAMVYPIVDLNILEDYGELKEHLCADLIPLKGNESYIKTIPHQMFNKDMVVIAKAVLADLSDDLDRYPMITIDNKMCKKLGVSSETVCKDAIDNSDTINPHEFMTVSDYLLGSNNYFENPEMSDFDNAKIPIRIMTTETGICQASVLLNKNVMEELANRYDSDFYLIPTMSGCFTVPMKFPNAKEIAKNIEKSFKEQLLERSGIEPIGALQYYDREAKVLEPNSEVEARINRTVEMQLQDQKQDVDRDKNRNERIKDLEH